jgi:serine/threonine-protein kinase
MPTDPHADTMAAETSGGHTVVGKRYELLALLGAGGMGNVYKARDLELDEVVALKILRRDVAGAPGALDRFRREVKLARRVTHANVARVFDIGELGEEKILTMELVDGEALSVLLEREGPLSLARCLEIASAICAGVGAAHAAGVVHRDLKPDNVMLAKDGRVVVTDFGIARAVVGETSKTFGGFVGTPAYMAPEQVEGTTIDERTDVFAFGAMLYEMATGAHPWQGDSALVVAAARLLHPPMDPRRHRADLPERLVDLVLRCLARNRDDRPAKMSDVAAVLSTISEARGTRSIPVPARLEPGLAALGTDKRVAVLPFINAGSEEHAYVAEGLTDDLIDALSVARGLRVHSRGVVRAYKSADRDARQIGRDLDVQVVVEGSVRKTPGAFRINARLVSVADGMQLWAKRFDGAESDMLALNDEIAREVALALTTSVEAARGNAMDAEAQDLYLRARLAYRGQYFPGSSASTLFERAFARAPEDPRVIAGYVMSRAVEGAVAEGPRLIELADKALRLAPSLPDPHVALGAIAFHSLRGVDAVRSFRRALRIASNNSDVHDVLGMILEYADEPRAIHHLQAALALEPTSMRAQANIGRHYALAGDWDRVKSFYEHALENPLLVGQRARMAMWRRDVAAAEALDRLEIDKSLVGMLSRAMIDVTLGRPVDRATFAISRGRTWSTVLFTQFAAEVCASAKNDDAALDIIESVTELGLFDIAWLDRCPLFADLRTHERFARARVQIAERASAIRDAYVAAF